MDPRKKVLILYASAGHGHEMAARAVYEALRAGSEVDAVCEDALEHTIPFFGRSYSKLYLFLIRRAPALWGFFYYLADIGLLRVPLAFLRRAVNSIFARPLVRRILREDPDVIVSTHFLPTEVAAHLKRRGRARAKLVTVITDFRPHAFWLCEPTDLYAVALPLTLREMSERGVPSERVLVSGIPIAGRFRPPADRRALRESMGLDAEAFTLLVTSGGAGVGSAEDVLGELLSREPSLQALFVCGTNEDLKRRVETLLPRSPRLKVYGFVDNMEELMGAADLLLGKAGGLTVTESLAVGTPLVVFRPVPGQEGRNAACLERSEAGVRAKDAAAAARAVLGLIAEPERLRRLREAAGRLGRPNAAASIARWVIDVR